MEFVEFCLRGCGGVSALCQGHLEAEALSHIALLFRWPKFGGADPHVLFNYTNILCLHLEFI